VARLRERLPAADEILNRLGGLAEDTTMALATGDVAALARTFEVAHGLLARLQLSSPELEGLCAGARAAGAAGAMLTGAGGGGAVIALAPGRERAVLARWREAGFDGLLATIAATPGGRPDADE
jgi:mevalonate kinase